MERNDDPDSTVATCDGCKSVVLVAVTHGLDRKGKNQIGRLAADGHSVSHMTCSQFRGSKTPFGCKCPDTKSKKS